MKNVFPIICTGLAFLFSATAGFAAVKISDVETAIMSENYKQSKSLAAELLKSSSDNTTKQEARYYLALSAVRLEEYTEARDIFKKLSEEVRDEKLRDKAYLGLFDSYYMTEDYKEALDVINKLMKISPRSEFLSLIYLKAARSNLKLANWDEARSLLKKITAQFPDSFEYHIAYQLLEEKQFFTVQIGAFMERQHAEELLHELKQKQEYSYIVETTDRQDRKFFRVRVGQLASLDEAYKLKNKLAKQGYPASIYP